MDARNRTIKLIEDDDQDADLYTQLLEERAADVRVEYIPARHRIAEYAELVGDPDTGAVIIDERLGELAGVDHTGLEVAGFLRAIRPELPIYILTNYANEIPDEQGEAVEYVIDKKTFRKATQVYVARILRAMQQYEKALTDQQRQLKELIDRKLSNELTDKEEEELQRLRSAIERPFAIAAMQQESRWKEELEEQKDLLERLERIVGGLRQDLDNEQE